MVAFQEAIKQGDTETRRRKLKAGRINGSLKHSKDESSNEGTERRRQRERSGGLEEGTARLSPGHHMTASLIRARLRPSNTSEQRGGCQQTESKPSPPFTACTCPPSGWGEAAYARTAHSARTDDTKKEWRETGEMVQSFCKQKTEAWWTFQRTRHRKSEIQTHTVKLPRTRRKVTGLTGCFFTAFGVFVLWLE